MVYFLIPVRCKKSFYSIDDNQKAQHWVSEDQCTMDPSGLHLCTCTKPALSIDTWVSSLFYPILSSLQEHRMLFHFLRLKRNIRMEIIFWFYVLSGRIHHGLSFRYIAINHSDLRPWINYSISELVLNSRHSTQNQNLFPK